MGSSYVEHWQPNISILIETVEMNTLGQATLYTPVMTTVLASNHIRQWLSSATRSHTAFQVAGKLAKSNQ